MTNPRSNIVFGIVMGFVLFSNYQNVFLKEKYTKHILLINSLAAAAITNASYILPQEKSGRKTKEK